VQESGVQEPKVNQETRALAERLERGEVVFYPVCPFALPGKEDLDFLLKQEVRWGSKNIMHEPLTGRFRGLRRRSSEQAERVHRLLAQFSQGVMHWLTGVLPQYAATWRPDQVTFRPIEESTRKLSETARNDLLHVDAFPRRPTNGWRILRVFANVNPAQPRIWATAETFPELMRRYGDCLTLRRQEPTGFKSALKQLSGLLQSKQNNIPLYDQLMAQFHHFLKLNRDFQEHCEKRLWEFPPGSAWMVFTDVATHAALKGRYALEHSFYISPRALVIPDQSPAAILERKFGRPVLEPAES
jgi:hypothetical protein